MNYRKELKDLIITSDGMLSTEQVEQYGIPRSYLSQLVKEGMLERTSHGIYTTPEAFEDEMFVLQHKRQLAIYSHETALYLHDLIDRDPLQFSMTVPRGYNTSNLKALGVDVYTVKKELHTLGETQVQTIFGRAIQVYNPERTLCDMVRVRNQIDPATLNQAFKTYTKRNNKDVSLLLEYSKMFRVEKVIRNYLEILL